MSEPSIDSPGSATTPNETPNETSTPRPLRCRFIKTAGDQCRARAMTGHHYCWHHRWNGRPQHAGVKGFDRVAFLEDTASIQLAVSTAMQGLLNRTMTESCARAMFYGANVANAVLRTDMLQRRWAAEHKQHPEEPVTEATDLDTSPLAPAQEYRGPDGRFEPYWSFSKYLYEQECERAGRPKPASPADMPPSGWMDQDEYFEDPDQWDQRYQEKLNAARTAAEASAQSTASTPAMPPEPIAPSAPASSGSVEDLHAVAAPASSDPASSPSGSLEDPKAAAAPERNPAEPGPPSPLPRPSINRSAAAPQPPNHHHPTHHHPTHHHPCRKTQWGPDGACASCTQCTRVKAPAADTSPDQPAATTCDNTLNLQAVAEVFSVPATWQLVPPGFSRWLPATRSSSQLQLPAPSSQLPAPAPSCPLQLPAAFKGVIEKNCYHATPTKQNAGEINPRGVPPTRALGKASVVR